MILYRKTFPLAKGLSFSRYVHLLDEKSFLPYILTFENISPYACEAEIDFAPQPFFARLYLVAGSMLFNKCKMEYIKDRKEIVFEASAGIWKILFALLVILSPCFMMLILLSVMLRRETSLNALAMVLIVFIIYTIYLMPWIVAYMSQRKFFKMIEAFALEPS